NSQRKKIYKRYIIACLDHDCARARNLLARKKFQEILDQKNGIPIKSISQNSEWHRKNPGEGFN
ncbi:MAG: hypothetical protein LBT59_09840, partial [Clostridiales bacterium]|nr:hypothetical protein [Clostridiales bacterium]